MNDYSDYIAEQEEKYDEIHSYQNGKETKKCSSCCVFRTMNYYSSSRTGRQFKTCDKCRYRNQKYKEKKELELKEQLIQKAEGKTNTTNSDPIQFINEILQYREDHKDDNTDDWKLKDRVKASKLYEKYNEWRLQNNREVISRIKFGRSISDLLPNKSRINRGIFYTF